MTFRSAASDFEETTLAALPTALARLEYLASLRTPAGEYEHWGLAKVYGEQEAERVLRVAHQEAVDAVLQRPMRELYEQAGEGPAVFEREARELLPQPVRGVRCAHFNLIWDVIASVARRHASRLPAA